MFGTGLLLGIFSILSLGGNGFCSLLNGVSNHLELIENALNSYRNHYNLFLQQPETFVSDSVQWGQLISLAEDCAALVNDNQLLNALISRKLNSMLDASIHKRYYDLVNIEYIMHVEPGTIVSEPLDYYLDHDNELQELWLNHWPQDQFVRAKLAIQSFVQHLNVIRSRDSFTIDDANKINYDVSGFYKNWIQQQAQ